MEMIQDMYRAYIESMMKLPVLQAVDTESAIEIFKLYCLP